ncbi:beta-lactamase family protein [Sphingopyxis indica]|uniref:serine hydrolase domain-containing protein n=1 Tax=Sphingopyxis indica TaxID=436663 RepID=UPI002938D632|nr:serine hydrolase domain-containing protein [Sphingopyxis indica]WOF44422.1 beta-lactamase family protein [Sphingopyxis indica]
MKIFPNSHLSPRLATALFAAATLPALPVHAAPQPPAASAEIETGRTAGLEDFVDGVLAQQLATREVAGAVVTVVKGGKVLFTRGYGFADVDRGIPVNGQKTLFRPGSVSKLITWTGLMQQVEAGKVDLDADVNRYIDFTIPPFEGQPIRVRDLLSHTPGMSDLRYDEKDWAKPETYQSFLKTHIPERLWAPGTEISYSNYGAALAGYIVERVSGEAFPDYVTKHIFQPLGMTHTTFVEPLTGENAANMALGYKFVDGRFEAKPYERYDKIMPAGSAASTAPDMARFMLAMLGGGALDGKRILTPESVALLESDSVANAPGLPGMAHGFMVAREKGPRLVGHGGNTMDFHSYLLLAPEADLGFFVSYTGGEGSYGARTELSDAIIGRLFPQQPAQRWTQASQTPPLGAYRSNRRDYSRPADPEGDLKLSAIDEHRILVEGHGPKTVWEQIGPNLYEQATGAREGGPYDQMLFYGDASDPRIGFASQPHVAYHLVKPVQP